MTTSQSGNTLKRKPLNVNVDRIKETRNRILGGKSNITETALDFESQSEEALENQQSLVSLIDKSSFESEASQVSNESVGLEENLSDTSSKSLSDDSKLILEHLKRPLVLGLREVVARQPRDPVDYLTRWLLNYQSCQEMLERRRQENEKLKPLKNQIQSLLSGDEVKGVIRQDQKQEEEEGGSPDSNFTSYVTKIAAQP